MCMEKVLVSRALGLGSSWMLNCCARHVFFFFERERIRETGKGKKFYKQKPNPTPPPPPPPLFSLLWRGKKKSSKRFEGLLQYVVT